MKGKALVHLTDQEREADHFWLFQGIVLSTVCNPAIFYAMWFHRTTINQYVCSCEMILISDALITVNLLKSNKKRF